MLCVRHEAVARCWDPASYCHTCAYRWPHSVRFTECGHQQSELFACSVSFLGPSSVLLPHNCDAHELSVSMRVARVRRRALHANDGRDRA